MRNVYCISGLGADHRVFRNLRLPGFDLVPVPWLTPDTGDTLPSYAARMYRSIPETDPIVLGLSFGGMLTTEIKKQFGISHAVIVSSAKTKAELGYGNIFFRWISGRRMLPDSLFLTTWRFSAYLAGACTEEERKLISDMKKSGSASTNRWTVDALLNWKNAEAPPGIVHIHGTRDRIIPPRNVRPTHWIHGGGHFMIYNRAPEVSEIILSVLSPA